MQTRKSAGASALNSPRFQRVEAPALLEQRWESAQAAVDAAWGCCVCGAVGLCAWKVTPTQASAAANRKSRTEMRAVTIVLTLKPRRSSAPLLKREQGTQALGRTSVAEIELLRRLGPAVTAGLRGVFWCYVTT